MVYVGARAVLLTRAVQLILRLIIAPLITFGPVPSFASAAIIPRCQHLLVGARDHLARAELDLYARLRLRDDDLMKYALGLLIAVYESDLDDEGIPMDEARTYVPLEELAANRYLHLAIHRELLTLDRSTANGRHRVVRAGPKLREVIDDEVEFHLARIAENVRAVTSVSIEADRPPADTYSPVRSPLVDRTVLRKICADYGQLWVVAGPENQFYLRHAYGLMVHAYINELREQSVTMKSGFGFMGVRGRDTRLKYLRMAVERGMITIERVDGTEANDRLRLTLKSTALVERRINFTIDRMNSITRKATGT